MIKLFPAKCHNENLHCSSSVWVGTTPQLSTLHCLFWIERCNFWSVFLQKPLLIVERWGKTFTSRTPFLPQIIVHITFQVEVVCLNFVFVGDEVCLQCMDCCFDLGASCDTHVSSPVTTWLKKFLPSSLYRVRKSKVPACCLNLCSSVSIFGTQCAHNFWNSSSSDTISWSDHEIWGNAGKVTQWWIVCSR